MSLFKLKSSGGPRDLELSMAGIKLGSDVLQIDGGDTGLIAALAKLVGLSGRACAVAETQASVEAFERSAKKAGVLVEVKRARLDGLPYGDSEFDLVVLKNVLGRVTQHQRILCLQQAFRVLRAAGRCLVIDQALRGGLGAVFAKPSVDRRYLGDGGALLALKAEGFRGVRLLAERGGLTYVEGIKLHAGPIGVDIEPGPGG